MEEKILDRLRKVLELSRRGGTEAESQAAAEMLQKLLTQYNLDIADLETRGHKAQGVSEAQGADLGKAAFKWKLDLAEVIAGHYFCAPMIDRVEKTVRFVGRPDNIESLKMLYAWLIEQIKQISAEERRKWQVENHEHVDPLRWQVNFGLGVVSRLGGRLAELKRKREESHVPAEDAITALVRVRDTEVSDYLEATYGYRVDGKKTQRELQRDKEWDAYIAKVREREKVAEARIGELQAAGDTKTLYAEFPHLDPAVIAKRKKETEAYWRKEEARERRNEARRTGPAYRPKSAAQVKRENQAYDAQASGQRAASKVNLEPFLTDGGASKVKGRMN